MNAEEMAKRVVQADQIPVQGTPITAASMSFLFGNVWQSKLSMREKRLISLVCAAISGHQLPLETHVAGALKSGDFSQDELHAMALHVAAYAGFPVGAGMDVMIQKVAAGLKAAR
jgi:4-carboxymuconolactone decarboxylase